mgnify:FL=1
MEFSRVKTIKGDDNLKKFVLFAFNGEAMCFVHVLLNGMDMITKGYDVKIIIEGAATKLLPEMKKEGSLLFGLYKKAHDKGIIEGVCRACSAKMETMEDALAMGLTLLDDMSGHPSISRYIEEGYVVITF